MIFERGPEGDNVNTVRYYFNLGSFDVYWFVDA